MLHLKPLLTGVPNIQGVGIPYCFSSSGGSLSCSFHGITLRKIKSVEVFNVWVFFNLM